MAKPKFYRIFVIDRDWGKDGAIHCYRDARDLSTHDPDPTYDSTGHIKMGRMPCPACMLERAIAKARGGAE